MYRALNIFFLIPFFDQSISIFQLHILLRYHMYFFCLRSLNYSFYYYVSTYQNRIIFFQIPIYLVIFFWASNLFLLIAIYSYYSSNIYLSILCFIQYGILRLYCFSTSVFFYCFLLYVLSFFGICSTFFLTELYFSSSQIFY